MFGKEEMTMSTRTEFDSIGSMEVPAEAYYGVQTLRANQNFSITGRLLNPRFITSLALLKKAAAITNMKAGVLRIRIGTAIVKACDEIIEGSFRDQFIVDAIQGGAGTSANMNANEVIANRAIELLGGVKGDYSVVHPNDHVNEAQSTNDMIPSAGKLTALSLLKELIDQMGVLIAALDQKAEEFDPVLKMGRTQLQDAVPMRLGQSFHAYASMFRRNQKRLVAVCDEMRVLNMGATAIGTSINATAEYVRNIVTNINLVTGEKFLQAEDLIDATQNLDGFVQVSSVLKSCAVSLSKMCNDLRLLSSGPKTGFGEINLPAKQNGSSIMPGKVNPVIPEVVSQVAFQVIGNDTTITMAAEAGQLELNAFEPVLFDNLFTSIEMLKNAMNTLVNNCILGITANTERCQKYVEDSVGVVTVLCPILGYKKSAEIAKTSLKTGVPVRKLILDAGLLSQQEVATIMNPVTMTSVKRISKVSKNVT